MGENVVDSAPVRRLADWDHDRLLALAADHGTPLYVLDPDRVAANYQRFAKAFPEATVMYAAKAHTGQAVLRRLVSMGVKIECAAGGEIKRALAAGADPNELQYTAVNPPQTDLEYATAVATENPGFTLTLGAGDTADRLAALGYDGQVAVRVNPGIGTGHHEKVATGKDAKFGIPYNRVPAFVANLRDQGFDVVGLHAHMGSGVLHDDLEKHCAAIEKVAQLTDEVDGLDFLDIGGGFGVPYREDVAPLELATVGNRVREAVGGIEPTLKLEPGRYIVADAEVILTTVNTVKQTPEATVVGVDASIATLVRPAMFGSYHPIRNVTGPEREQTPVAIGGPCCTSADVFATDRPVAAPKREDILAIGNAGAYGYELASQFHSQPRPAEVTVDGRVVRRRETLTDVTRVEREAPGISEGARDETALEKVPSNPPVTDGGQ